MSLIPDALVSAMLNRLFKYEAINGRGCGL